ncbi:protein piccolo [Podospora fimiseda]|uniref:Protein piccolo n=1 Tax=Podospora fimiseda TaxID=252190 RepID=A0AAN7BZ06_9PEZI|nr:protein piccolo [Podospora fimiseda]
MNGRKYRYDHVEQLEESRPSLSEVTPHAPPREPAVSASASHSHHPTYPDGVLPSFTSGEFEERIYDPPTVARAYGRPVIVEGPYRQQSGDSASPQSPPPGQPAEWEASFNASMLTDFREDLARLDGVVTPGIDNTPFIQYAIEALSRDRDTGYSGANHSSSSESGPRAAHQQQQQRQQHPQPQPHPNHGPSQPPQTMPAPPGGAPTTSHQLPGNVQTPRPFLGHLKPNPGASADSLAESLIKGAKPQEWRSADRQELLTRPHGLNLSGVPPLTYKPWALRPLSLISFMAVCALMIAALAFCAVWSHQKQGFIGWATIYGGRYFIFRVLPQLVGAAILLYAQFIIATIFRTLPFVRLASERIADRDGAIFQELYPSYLWPKLVGPWNVWVPIVVTWLMNFTIPLLSSLFTVILADETWTWATCEGVAWALVALYVALLISTIITWRYWAMLEQTGLIWDPRSLADIIAIVSETNTAADYKGTQQARGVDGMRFALRRRGGDKLGYWTWKDGRPGFWHTLGAATEDSVLIPFPDLTSGHRMSRQDEKKGLSIDQPGGYVPAPDHDPEAASPISLQVRYRYLPSCLQTSQLLYFNITAFILLAALFVVSFLPATRIFDGFRPGLLADPQPGGFSPADLIYSFVPAVAGMALFLLFQTLDLHLRVLQPWASLSDPHGALAEQSILVDYASCAPLEVTFRALKNKHWRVATISLASTLFISIPVLAGGVFMALTTPKFEVRMFPNVAIYGCLLAMLVVYFLALLSFFPSRQAMRLPHGVTRLAEIIGFLVNDELRDELAFKRCMSRDEMLDKLGVGRGEPELEPKWVFGVGEPTSGNHGSMMTAGGELGIRRLRRFTEKRKIRKSQIRRGRGGGSTGIMP